MYYTMGMLAHVDAGKTTFSEQILYLTNAIRNLGRVDHADAFMDDHPIERERGITVFNSQASVSIGNNIIQLLDTPGHADFSGEMERAVSVLDMAVVLISCVEGIQSHVLTVWKLLRKYKIPTVFFLNKTDRAGADPDHVLKLLKKEITDNAVDMRSWPDQKPFAEEIAIRDEELLDIYTTDGYDRKRWTYAISRLFFACQIYPVMAGSALQGKGIKEFIGLMDDILNENIVEDRDKQDTFTAKVYKVRTDAKQGRLVYMKILTGNIEQRTVIPGTDEKITSLYLIQGQKLEPISKAYKGMICAAGGLSAKAGEILGKSSTAEIPVLRPVLAASAKLPKGMSPVRFMEILHLLEDEDPLLHVEWQKESETALLHVMGSVQIETIRSIMKLRFGIDIDIGKCKVKYTETIADECEGIGHYEPLRHYAEVRVLLLPAPRGSGITFESQCHVDFLSMHWQLLIKDIMLKKAHVGVLTGAELTDVKIVLINGKNHLKHTEGGDFYEASVRAVRNALMRGKSLLLEPLSRFELKAPSSSYDLIMKELLMINADLADIDRGNDTCTISGAASLQAFLDILEKLPAMTHGKGNASWEADGYIECRDAQRIIEDTGYDPLADLENSPNSVFCAKGAGFTVKWDEAEAYAHTHGEAHY